ncbi:MAG: alpha-L-arabinofuranosidase [Bacteroidaceae bacterium]|nr:alpha-L-arabinofuranosidase [Bacteroidaceae bacterium]
MKRLFFALTILSTVILTAEANVPDSVSLIGFNARPQDGLSFAYSSNGHTWMEIANGTSFVKSDYGAWGAEKKMHTPSLARKADGMWVAVWSVNNRVNQFAIATTPDLFHWKPQDYPFMSGVGQCLDPLVAVVDDIIIVRFHNAQNEWFQTQSTDAYHFSEPVKITEVTSPQKEITLNGHKYKGDVLRVSWNEVEYLINSQTASEARHTMDKETCADDNKRFAVLEEVKAKVNIDINNSKPISDKLIGIFFEDINYSADGGLYAELIQNRDFEYNEEEGGKEPNWTASNSWKLEGEGATFTISTESPIHPNQAHYAVLDVVKPGACLTNDGFDGIRVCKGEKYDVSIFTRLLSGKGGKLRLVLRNGDKIIGETSISSANRDWARKTAVIKANEDAENACLSIIPTKQSKLAFDIVSLFPQKTYKNRKNGLRRDLADALEQLKPRFMRFPGGCVTHGDGLENIYHWKETIGPIETRKGARNIWGYHQTRGLGFYEFFLMCEDMGMEPLPVLAAGVPCQNSSRGGGGQQGGIPMEKMGEYIQDLLDLIEWANGDPKTNKWAKMRAEAGHPKPFNLHYLGIGNEDLISETFTERYLMIIKAVKAKYPNIQICGTAGPFYEGSDYEQGWRLAKDNAIDMIDEHYYVSPGWYFNHQDFYDNYDRSASKVYLGEYASHGQGRKLTMETALTCAMHICNLERNGDIVSMSSYAPLLAKANHTQWNPDLIYFDNGKVTLTTDYYTQMLHGQHSGDRYVDCSLSLEIQSSDVRKRLAISTVNDTRNGKTYLKIVNILPKSVKTEINCPGLASKTTKVTTLQGAWDSQKVEPQTSAVDVSDRFNYELPPYSFTIIEL